MLELTVLFRPYCSLCHDMLAQLKPFQEQHGFTINVIDVDDNDRLLAKYDELVPVLLHNDVEICHWHLDEQGLSAYLASLS